MGKVMKAIGNGAARTAEYVTSELALPVAAASMAGTGNYLQKVVSGVSDVGSAIGNAAYAYVTDAGIRTTMNSGAMGLAEVVGNVGMNLVENPIGTGLTALGTYVGLKALPQVTRAIRKGAARRHGTLDDAVETRADPRSTF